MADSATSVTFGISRVTGTFIQSVETTAKIETKVLKNSKGQSALINTYDPTTSGSVKGHGALALAPGIGDPGVSGLGTGGVSVIEEVKNTEGNEEFAGWDYNFKYFPNGTALVAS